MDKRTRTALSTGSLATHGKPTKNFPQNGIIEQEATTFSM